MQLRRLRLNLRPSSLVEVQTTLQPQRGAETFAPPASVLVSLNFQNPPQTLSIAANKLAIIDIVCLAVRELQFGSIVIPAALWFALLHNYTICNFQWIKKGIVEFAGIARSSVSTPKSMLHVSRLARRRVSPGRCIPGKRAGSEPGLHHRPPTQPELLAPKLGLHHPQTTDPARATCTKTNPACTRHASMGL